MKPTAWLTSLWFGLTCLLVVLTGCNSNVPDIGAVDFGEEAWEHSTTYNRGRYYYQKRCGAELQSSWAAGTPEWKYLDCWEANGGFRGKHPHAISVHEWRDRQVAWETMIAEQESTAILKETHTTQSPQ